MTTLILTLIGLIIGAIAAYYAFKQFDHLIKHKDKDIIVNVHPEIKIEQGIKVAESNIEKNAKMNEEYYTKLGVSILRSKKHGDDFDIYETK